MKNHLQFIDYPTEPPFISFPCVAMSDYQSLPGSPIDQLCRRSDALVVNFHRIIATSKEIKKKVGNLEEIDVLSLLGGLIYNLTQVLLPTQIQIFQTLFLPLTRCIQSLYRKNGKALSLAHAYTDAHELCFTVVSLLPTQSKEKNRPKIPESSP